MESPVVWGWSRASGPESIRKLAKCSRSSGRRTIFYTGTIMNNQHKNSQNTTKTKYNALFNTKSCYICHELTRISFSDNVSIFEFIYLI